MNEDQLAEEIRKIEALKQENKNIDADALISNLLARNQEDSVPAAGKARAYVVSLLFPPFGLYYVIKYFFQGTADARRAAWVCLTLTVGTIIILWWTTSAILSSSPQLQQIQNIDLKQLQELTQ